VLGIFEFVAILCSTLFTGAAVYVNLVEHPTRMVCGTELAATVFAPSYKRAAVMQASLAGLSSMAAIACWLLGAGILWLVGALFIFSVIPFTLTVIMPTNKRLLDPALDRSSADTHALLVKWGRLHAVRSALSLIASVIFVVLAIIT
jgi:Domain of unknown function (DUF1772)